MIENITQAEAALQPYVPLVAQLTGKDTTLERIVPLMALIGNPQERLRVVHIAGTSGKTSVAYYIAALLGAAGKTTGLTVSPHVDSLTERVQINGRPLPDAEFCSELDEFLGLVRQVEQPPSYFELLYAFSLWVFERRGVDYAVIETGMGGLYDATNVAKRADKICVITDIGFDHMQVLGHTLPEITAQKIGITHEDNQVYMYRQADEIMRVIEDWVNTKHAKLSLTTEVEERSKLGFEIADLPEYQQRNWLLAYYVYRNLAHRDGLGEVADQQLQATLKVQVPGRMDARQVSGKTIVMDGAHNGQKMQAFVDSFAARYPGVKPVVLVALKTGKEYEAVVPLLASLSSEVIVTTFETSQDLPAKSIDPQILAQAFKDNGFAEVSVIADHRQAYRDLIAATDTIGVVTGSFYLLSQIRRISA